MSYQAIQSQACDFPVNVLCRVLAVYESGYYAWKQRSPSRRQQENHQLIEAIRSIHQRVRQRYGSPRMYRELLGLGFCCSENRVARLMRQGGIIARRTLRFRSLTKAGSRGWAAPHLLKRNFDVAQANTVWAADISYIPTGEGHLYLAVILDLYSRRIVGWSLGERLGATLASQALKQALAARHYPHNLLHHSDRDGLYTSAAYQHYLAAHQIQVSMSRKGNCWDNACVESFFSSLKNELVKENKYQTKEQARLSIFEYIEVFYNRNRRHSTLGYVSPVDFEDRNIHP